MKRRDLLPVALSFVTLVLALIVGGLVILEVFRNKGQIQVIASGSRSTNGEVTLTVVVSNLDWRVSLDQIEVSLNVNMGFSLGRVLKPDNVQTSTNLYGPSNEWKEIVVCYPSKYSLKPKRAAVLEVVLVPNPMFLTNRITGRVSYRGAQIWERVGMGQINGVDFRAPISGQVNVTREVNSTRQP